MDIFVADGDGNLLMQTSWTSSGETTAFESLEFEAQVAQAQAIELQGVLDDSEWLSFMEVFTYSRLRAADAVYLSHIRD